MDEQNLGAEESASEDISMTMSDFPQIIEDFAWANQCSDCPFKEIYRKNEMCLKVYNELLENFSMGKAIEARCSRRG